MRHLLSDKIKWLIFLLFLGALFAYPGKARAATSCTANVNPSSITANSTGNVFTFSVTNTGDTAVDFVTIRRPSGDFFLNNIGVSGWTVGATSEVAFLSEGNIDPGNSTDFVFHVHAGSNEVASTNWSISVGPGGSEINCTGSLGTAISGTVDTSPPVISGISVSDITSSSAIIGWTTDESSDSSVGYDTNPDYSTEQKVNSATLTTSHSLGITGLTSGTAYYYYVESTDGSGNTRSEEGTLTTATATSAGTSTTTTTTTVTVTVTPTPAPKDTSRPGVTLSTNFDDPFETAPLIEGRATDNKGVSKIEYSTDGGENWLSVDEIESVGAKSTSFSFVPELFEDGNYDLLIRAKDAAGNIGKSSTKTLVLDRLPPRIGGNLLSLGPQPLLPNEDGVIVTMAGLEIKITLSAVGGPISVDLLVNEEVFSFSRSTETGLWSGTVTFPEPGLYQLKTHAVDGAGNETDRNLNPVLVVGPGKVADEETKELITEGKVSLFVQDPLSRIWSLWDGKPFDQENPQNINENGTYQFFLPPGKYFLKIKSPGFATLTSRIFQLVSSTPLNADFQLSHGIRIKIGFITFTLPEFFAKKAEVILKTPAIPESVSTTSLVGEEASNFILTTTGEDSFELNDLRGQSSVLSFVSTWSPPSLEQIPVIDTMVSNDRIPVVLVSLQETASKLSIFKRKGNYEADFVVDRDGDLIADYNINSLPTHYFLDRKGVVTRIVTGVLNEQEIKTLLAEN